MSKHVTVRLTVPQAEALDNAAALVWCGDGDGWTATEWATLGRARDKLIAGLDAAGFEMVKKEGR